MPALSLIKYVSLSKLGSLLGLNAVGIKILSSLQKTSITETQIESKIEQLY